MNSDRYGHVLIKTEFTMYTPDTRSVKPEKRLRRNQEKYVKQNLQAAAHHLKMAADCALHECGDDFVSIYEEWSCWPSDDLALTGIENDFQTIESEIKKLATALDTE